MALPDQSDSDPTMVTAADYETQHARPHIAALETENKRLRAENEQLHERLRRIVLLAQPFRVAFDEERQR